MRGLILAFVVTLHGVAAQAQQYAALVMDARTGQVLHAVNADTRLHPASLTKMMTLYIVFDQVRQGRIGLDQPVRISQNAANEPPSRLGLRAGQSIELRYLIRAAAVRSANDAATALGEAVAGSEAAFIDMMNAYARAMGLNNTTFRNAHGLTQAGHMSTARDMAVLGRRLLFDFPQYYNLFSRNATSAGIATVHNTNRRLLDAYDGADGIKTGFTRAAGFNLVASAERGGRRVIVSLFGGRTADARNQEVARLMDLGFARMPATAQIVRPAPLNLRVEGPSAGSTVSAAAPVAGGITRSVRPRARPGIAVAARPAEPVPAQTATPGAVAGAAGDPIALAIAEINAELAEGSSVDGPASVAAPAPRPGAIFQPGAAPALSRAESDPAPPFGQSSGTDSWGVQVGAFRSRAEAERMLLATALRDVEGLDGAFRKVEAVSVSGITLYRAQFVGLSAGAADRACAALIRANAECATLPPGS